MSRLQGYDVIRLNGLILETITTDYSILPTLSGLLLGPALDPPDVSESLDSLVDIFELSSSRSRSGGHIQILGAKLSDLASAKS